MLIRTGLWFVYLLVITMPGLMSRSGLSDTYPMVNHLRSIDGASYLKSAPAGITLTAKPTSVAVSLKWVSTAKGVRRYKLFRDNTINDPISITGNQTIKPLAVIDATQSAFQDDKLKPMTKYCYLLVAYNTKNVIVGHSNVACTTTLKATRPTPPTGLVATLVSQNQINLSWKDNSNNETGFVIERSNTETGPFTLLATVGPNVTTYQDKGLAATTKYCYRVYVTPEWNTIIIFQNICVTTGP